MAPGPGWGAPLIRWEPNGAVVVAFSERQGGVSDGPYASLNLGLLTEDEPARVEENRRRLCARLDAEPERAALNRQVHGARVNRAVPGGRGTPGDAIWTDEAELPVMVLTADCLPIALAVDGPQPRIALVHAGWRGLLAGVVEAAVAELGRAGHAALGSGIGPCCYEVGEDVAAAFRDRFGAGVVRGRRVDLAAAAAKLLRDTGWQVEDLGDCTSCNPERFFSHRRDGGLTGRQGAIALVRGG